MSTQQLLRDFRSAATSEDPRLGETNDHCMYLLDQLAWNKKALGGQYRDLVEQVFNLRAQDDKQYAAGIAIVTQNVLTAIKGV